MRRARQALLLAVPTLRATAWLPLLPAGALGLAVLTFEGPVLLQLRLAAVALCVGAAFVLDDAAAETLATSPASLVFRRFLRIGLALPLVAALWALALWYAGTGFDAALTLELVAMLAVTLGAAAFAIPHLADGRGGAAAAPALLVFLGACALVVPDAWTLFAQGPGDPRWDGSHLRWTLVLVVAVAGFVYASGDPARARPLRRGAEPIRRLETTDLA